jgi:hypothetical protein
LIDKEWDNLWQNGLDFDPILDNIGNLVNRADKGIEYNLNKPCIPIPSSVLNGRTKAKTLPTSLSQRSPAARRNSTPKIIR